MSQFTPLIRKKIDLEVPVSGDDILAAAKDVIQQDTHQYRLHPREGWDDAEALVYVRVHSADKREEIVVIPEGDGVDFFYKKKAEYTHLVVELHSLNDDATASSRKDSQSDEAINEAIGRFAEDLRDLLYGE